MTLEAARIELAETFIERQEHLGLSDEEMFQHDAGNCYYVMSNTVLLYRNTVLLIPYESYILLSILNNIMKDLLDQLAKKCKKLGWIDLSADL